MNSDIRILHGLSIATLVFSILGLLAGGAFLFMVVSASSLLSDPNNYQMIVEELQGASSGSAAFDGSSAASMPDYSALSDEQLKELISVSISAVIVMAVGYMLLHIVGIVASVFSMNVASRPEKAGRAMVWSIVGVVCMALTFSVITCVCFIIEAWMSSRVRRNLASFEKDRSSGQISE